MTDLAIKVENLSKAYQMGPIGTGTISRDLERWWTTKIRRKEDPFLKIGETNDRTVKGESDIVWSLKDINFEIAKGDAVGIIGRNGAGKSTLLKLLSRITAPTTGNIKVKGRIASLLEVGTGFHPELSGRENIYLNGAILGMRKKEIDRKFDEIVDFSGVERYIDTPVKRYSSGMYVRLAFAVAAHLESEILIVDEVLAVGDAEFQKKCLGKMGEVSKGEGRTVLFVSHSFGSLQKLCQKSILLNNGLISDIGFTMGIINKYRSLETPNANWWVRSKAKNGVASFISAGIVSSLNGDFENVLVKNKLNNYFKLEIEIEKTNFDGSFAFEIVDQSNNSIICSHNTDLLTYMNEKGVYNILIKIPTILRVGHYSVNLGSNYSTGFATLEYIPEAFGFECIDEKHSSQMDMRPGIIFSPLKWEIASVN